MQGGLLIGSGNNTCVYSPPVECSDGSEIPVNHVSRIVPDDSIEPDVQVNVKQALKRMNPKYLKHFNLATKICKAKFKDVDLNKECTVKALQGQIQLGKSHLINMLTPTQESDINKKDGSLYKDLRTTNNAIKDFLHAIVEMNSFAVQIFHTDAHLGNVSWKGDIIVLHDWEKAIITDRKLLDDITGPLGSDDAWRLLGTDKSDRAYLMDYPCWGTPLQVMEVFDLSPITHHSVQLLHSLYFRFWDILSICTPLKQIYMIANINEPVYINKIMKKVLEYFYYIFTVVMLEGGDKSPYYDGFSGKDIDMLKEITVKLHSIIDSEFVNEEVIENNKLSVDAELLKLVAKHATSSPSKQVLKNMLPIMNGGGRSRKNVRRKRSSALKSKRKKISKKL